MEAVVLSEAILNPIKGANRAGLSGYLRVKHKKYNLYCFLEY